MSKFILSTLEEYILMSILARDLYGLEIAKTIKTASEGKYKVSVGSLYPALNKLTKKGLVESYWGDEQLEERNGARRKYYCITGEGELALEQAHQIRLALAPTFQGI
ncbi:MAG: helix-turn-helix transcriptional regulator [Spirulina sp. SIO3F2]|nr:helix-turn-helix transcriptional regulator [Spirulina sp. SIO3F2]